MLTTLLAFIAALALLIAVHEYGHYRVALACGIKVLRFSIGFGKPLLRWTDRRGTEFVLAALPLGGYVRMLDEREAPVPAEMRHLAFNTQPLRSRAAVVVAGPLANLLLAVLLYSAVSWLGVKEAEPVLSQPLPGSFADQAGLRAQEWVVQLAPAGSEPMEVTSFEDLQWQLTQAAVQQQDLRLWVAHSPQGAAREVLLPLSNLGDVEADASMLRQIGLVMPWSAPVMGEVDPAGAAHQAGLLQGDRVLRVDDLSIVDSLQLRQRIRGSVDKTGRAQEQHWQIDRGGRVLELIVAPRAVQQGEEWIGRIGAYVGSEPASKLVRYGPVDGVLRGVQKTWEVSSLSLSMMGKMLLGQASLKNLSGPLSIADFAGKSASMGLTAYLVFLAAISVSLGVLNLLPVPVLDGGHLMYYLWEAATGRPVSDVWAERLQRGGVAILLALMSLAMFNDVARLLG